MFNYSQYERMSSEEKDRYCDENGGAIQELIHQNVEREHIIEYNLQKSNDNVSNRNQFKRQLISTSHVDEYEVHGPDANNPFTFVSRGAKRKPSGQKDKDTKENKDCVILDDDHTTSTIAGNDGRLFRNGRSRTNKNYSDIDSGTYYATRRQHMKRKVKNKQYITTSENGSDLDDSITVRKTNMDENENENENVIKKNKNSHTRSAVKDGDDKKTKFSISKHALQYAVEHHLPSINIQCQPKIYSHDNAKEIIKALFNHMERNFRQLNKSYRLPTGFDYWFINKDGNLTCYTRHAELFVYSSEPSNYLITINNTDIVLCKPRHLSSQNSIILRFIPNYITYEEIQNELNLQIQSLYNVEEMKGSKIEKYKHVRIELKSNSEYEQILRSGGITIDEQLIEMQEFLAPPRLLMCSKCNEPDHIRVFPWSLNHFIHKFLQIV